ncbi:putative acetyltransferase [Mycolicibacterium agri]|uniref:Putative acetyltransferase n=2 Tax=Mycolicibacterium agri TaxID=36811 RepID=A0A7I9VTW3_MYCAG|nr:putative acetyltransferase [Mycolicibacterium agri]
MLAEVDVRIHPSAAGFRDLAAPLYQRDRVGNTIELTLLRSDTNFGDDALLLSVWDGDEVVGVALQTPPYPLACNGLPLSTHRAVAEALAVTRPELNGVRGNRDLALAFAGAWHAATGRPAAVEMEERLYRLGTLRAPSVSGEHREATADDTAGDTALLVDWIERFFVETSSRLRDRAAAQRYVDNARAVGDRFLLWEDGGAPVSVAMLRAPAAGVSRVGPVFTPRHARGHGYGSAVTAAAADTALREGVDDVVLFADLANPTSNAIYQRIGFEPVGDSVRMGFTTG